MDEPAGLGDRQRVARAWTRGFDADLEVVVM
jgi:hypothetical protein